MIRIDIHQLSSVIESYQPFQEWGFTVSRKTDSMLICESQWCKMRYVVDKDLVKDSLLVFYGRLHALDDVLTMEYGGQMYSCWHTPGEIHVMLRYLDGQSPQEAYETRHATPQWLKDFYAQQNQNKEKTPAEGLNLDIDKVIWDRYGLRFFELLDIHRPDLWDGYISFLKEYYRPEYEREEEMYKRIGKVFKMPDVPKYKKI